VLHAKLRNRTRQ